MAKSQFPAYCLHRATNQSFCTIKSATKRKPHYLGDYGSELSLSRYAEALRSLAFPDATIAIAITTARETIGRQTTSETPITLKSSVTVQHLYNEFQKWAPTHYRLPSGDISGEVDNFRYSFVECLDVLGSRKTDSLTRADLLAVRQRMIDRKLSRKVVNQRIGRIIRVFIWGGDEDRRLVPDSVAAVFRLVKPLKPFRSEAPETEPVEPVPVDDLRKVLEAAYPALRAMLTLQLLTAMRPGEVRALRKRMVKQIDGRWVADFGRTHKMAYKGKQRIIPLGAQAVAILEEWMTKATDDQHLFRPEFSPKSKNRKRLPAYTISAYTLAVRHACQKAGVVEFGPNRIRHLAATEIRREFGLEAAQAVLGHSHHSTTERYASPVSELAVRVAEKRG